MNFLSHNLPLVPDADRNMAGLLFQTIALPFSLGDKASPGSRLVYIDCLYFQLVNIGTIIVFGVRNRRLERLLDDDGSLLRTECQNVKRLCDRQAANLIGYQTPLLRGEMNFSCNSSSRCHHASL